MIEFLSNTMYIIFYLANILLIHNVIGNFTPPRNNYDAYGVKIAMNEQFLVLAENSHNPPLFFIKFAPFYNTHTSLQCYSQNETMINSFIYTVAVGKKLTNNQIHFYFAGELTDNRSGIFIGVAIYNTPTVLSDMNDNVQLLCNVSFTYHIQYIFDYEHQEYYILGVDPYGYFTYGFSNEFIFIYDIRNTSILDMWNANLTWPNPTFIPHGVDISDNFGVITGFIFNGIDSTVLYSPTIYLMKFNPSNRHPIVVYEYKPVPNPGTWQDLLTNDDANIYSDKYDMSVSINEKGEVFVGMQFINRVFLFSVDKNNPSNLTFISRNTNGRSLGNGKSIAWLYDGIAALIVNVYTLDYEWVSSQIHIYDIDISGYNSSSVPLTAFPNTNQKIPHSLSSIFIDIVSSPSSLALLDSFGHILIFLPTPAGFYSIIKDTGTIPLITTAQPCLPGTFKNKSGIHGCSLCPMGTKNPGNFTTFCVPCSSNSFCSLGSVADVPQSTLKNIIQAIPYPKSPDSVSFEDILIKQMFYITGGRCLALSPLFWTLILCSFLLIIVIIIGITKYTFHDSRQQKIRKFIQNIFRHTDLIGEGELWVGGLASFCVVALIGFAAVFSSRFIKQYPIETSEDSSFVCDSSLRNAKFQTSLQSLAIPPVTAEQTMFDLLGNQAFILNINLVNTYIKCDAISIDALFGLVWSTIRWSSCDNINATLILSIPLPFQHISVQVNIADVKTIGALRIGLYGTGQQQNGYELKQTNFTQSFFKNEFILARSLAVSLSLTKVINETSPIDVGDSTFNGIFIATFTVDPNSLFFTNEQFVRSNETSTNLNIIISETAYYVKNIQEPIAKPSEVVFQNLLFSTVCLELFGLVFLSFKLIFKPLYYRLTKKKATHSEADNHNSLHECLKCKNSVLENTYVDPLQAASF